MLKENSKLKLDIKVFSLLGIVCLLNTILCFSGAFLSWNDIEYLALGLISGLISCVFVYLCFKKLKNAKNELVRLEKTMIPISKLKLDIKVYSLLLAFFLINSIVFFVIICIRAAEKDFNNLSQALITEIVCFVFSFLCFKSLKNAKKQLLEHKQK